LARPAGTSQLAREEIPTMPDPTEMVLTGAFAAAVVVFCVAVVLRAWSGGKPPTKQPDAAEFGGSEASSYEPPPLPPELSELPVGRVPVWFYRPVDLLGVVLVFGLFAGLILTSLRAAQTQKPELTPDALLVNIGFQFLMAGLVALLVTRRVGLIQWLGLRWPAWTWMVLIAPGTVLLMWLVFSGLQFSGYVEWMQSLGVETVQDTVRLLQESEDPLVLGLMAFAAVIAAPLCEEIVFRGYLYPVMKKFGGMTVAAGCSALIFAAAHGNLTALLPLFIFGIVLVFLYEKTGSLWAPIATHFCFNGATVIAQMAVRYYEIPIELPQ